MTDHTRTEKIGGDSIDFCGHPSRAGNRYDNRLSKHKTPKIDLDFNKKKKKENSRSIFLLLFSFRHQTEGIGLTFE